MESFTGNVKNAKLKVCFFPDCISLWFKNEVGTKVALSYRDQAVSWLVHLGGAKTGVLSCQTKWSKKWRGWGDLEPMPIASCKVAKWENIQQDNCNAILIAPVPDTTISWSQAGSMSSLVNTIADILACLLDLNFKQSKLTRLNL
jgi:hypothetical protein